MGECSTRVQCLVDVPTVGRCGAPQVGHALLLPYWSLTLFSDFVSYACFAWANLHFPPNHSVFMHIFRWVLGWSLILFNLWVKMDAHRVVKDYAWYWGDAFWLMVMQHDLVFDGVYEIAPHPMYSVGYAGYYGLSMGESLALQKVISTDSDDSRWLIHRAFRFSCCPRCPVRFPSLVRESS